MHWGYDEQISIKDEVEVLYGNYGVIAIYTHPSYSMQDTANVYQLLYMYICVCMCIYVYIIVMLIYADDIGENVINYRRTQTCII